MIKNKMFCIKCNKYRKFKNIKIPYIFDKKLVLSIICNRCSRNEGYIFKVLYIYSKCLNIYMQILKIIGSINNNEWVKYIVSNVVLILCYSLS